MGVGSEVWVGAGVKMDTAGSVLVAVGEGFWVVTGTGLAARAVSCGSGSLTVIGVVATACNEGEQAVRIKTISASRIVVLPVAMNGRSLPQM